jgi:predicted O-methyltransferase YrrM
MNKKFIAYVKKNHEVLYYQFVKSEFLVSTLSKLDFFRYILCHIQNKPYFGVYMMAGQTWEDRKPYMQFLIKKEITHCETGSFRLLEVGSWAGNSALTWAEAIKSSGQEGEIVCVDPWIPYVKPEKNMVNMAPKIMEKALNNNKILKLFLHNIGATDISKMVTPIRGTSDKVLPMLKESNFNIIFIDGAHYFSNVIRDFQNAEKLICEGGILCGDDLELQSHEVDIDFAEKNKELNWIREPKTGKEFHPGVTMAVHVFFKKPVSAYNGFWAMRKIKNGWETVNLDLK